MEPPTQATSSFSDLFAAIRTDPAVDTEPVLHSQQVIAHGGDYMLHDQQFLQEQEALQLLNQSSAFTPSLSSSALPAASSPSPKLDVKPPKAKASKKRQRASSDDASADDPARKMTAVSLSREKLLQMTSADLDIYMRDVMRRKSSLTAEEMKDLRWMKRLVRNRESAQVSRDRKKNRLDELSGIWDELKEEQKQLTETLTALEISNKALKEELNNLISIVRGSPALATLWNNMHILRKRTTAKISDDRSIFNNQSAAAMCLMLAMHTYQQTLAARAVEAVEEPVMPLARAKCMDATDDLRSEMQYVVDHQQPQLPSGDQPVLLMLLPQTAAASVLRNQVFAQQALVLDLAGAQLVPAVPVQS